MLLNAVIIEDELNGLINLKHLLAEHCKDVEVIGDALAPGLIADAVFSGHLAARNFLRNPEDIEKELFMREIPSLV